MWAIFHKEFHSFLHSLIAYLVIGVFLVAISFFMWIIPEENILDGGYAHIDTLFSIAPYMFLFLIPAITMRSFAEEKKTGTYELLLTKPISELSIILGKYFACFALALLAIAPTVLYYISIYLLADPVGNVDTPGIVGSYIGLVFLAAIFTAFGILASALADNQITAFIFAILACYVVYTGFGSLSTLFGSGTMADFVDKLGTAYHYNAISRGLIDSRDVLYFASVITLTISATYMSLKINSK